MTLADELAGRGVRTITGARLADFTTFRLGGACPVLVDCDSEHSFSSVWPLLGPSEAILLGGGSNLLVSDAGLTSPVVRYVSTRPEIYFDGTAVRVSAGTLLDDLARITAERGLDGMVMCSGIPGTVGGAVAGNAGAFGEQIGDRVVVVQTMDRRGHKRERVPSGLAFAYRRSALAGLDEVIVSVRLQLDAGDREKLLARRAGILALRASKHPDWRVVPTAGSFFKNIEPTSKADRRQAAGWFLEQAGALRMSVGSARTFERHANIIVSGPGGRSRDVARLSEMMAGAVEEKFGLRLEREVKMLGAF